MSVRRKSRREAAQYSPFERQRQHGKDIVQLYLRDMRQMREKRRKVTEIQRTARLKEKAEEDRIWGGRKESRQPPQKAAKGREKLPQLGNLNKSRPAKHSQQASPTYAELSGKGFLPSIHGSRVYGDQGEAPVKDPRFQELLSSLLTTQTFYGDVQRFAPSTSQHVNVNNSILKDKVAKEPLFVKSMEH